MLCCLVELGSSLMVWRCRGRMEVCGFEFRDVAAGCSWCEVGRGPVGLLATLVMAMAATAAAVAAGLDGRRNEPEEIAITRWTGVGQSHRWCAWFGRIQHLGASREEDRP